MKTIELPCTVGDTVYYTTEWDKHGFQKDHIVKVAFIKILEENTLLYTDGPGRKVLLLRDYKKTWFTDKDEWLEECKILREVYKYEKNLRKLNRKGIKNDY